MVRRERAKANHFARRRGAVSDRHLRLPALIFRHITRNALEHAYRLEKIEAVRLAA
jgi:hypothetical protein